MVKIFSTQEKESTPTTGKIQKIQISKLQKTHSETEPLTDREIIKQAKNKYYLRREHLNQKDNCVTPVK